MRLLFLVALAFVCTNSFAADKAILWNGTLGREKGTVTDPVVVQFSGGANLTAPILTTSYMNITPTFPSPAASNAALRVLPYFNFTTNNTALSHFGIITNLFSVDNSTGNFKQMVGIAAEVEHRGNGTTNVTGISSVVEADAAAGNIVNMISGDFATTANLDGSGFGSNITNSYGVKISGSYEFSNTTNVYDLYMADNPLTDGKRTNHWGIYINNITSNTTNHWSIYTVGDSPSVFGGPVGVGTTNPTALVVVATSSSAPTAALYIKSSGTGPGLVNGIVMQSGNAETVDGLKCSRIRLLSSTGPLEYIAVTCP